jgi:hypothetical protein
VVRDANNIILVISEREVYFALRSQKHYGSRLNTNISFNTQFNVSISGHRRSVTTLSRVLCILSFVCAILCLILASNSDNSIIELNSGSLSIYLLEDVGEGG